MAAQPLARQGGNNMTKTLRLLSAVLLVAGSFLAHGVARAEQVKLTWFMWSGSTADVEAWKHVASLVTEKYPDIAVEFQTASWMDYWTKLPALAAAGQLPDIISLQSMRAPGVADLMLPLDARIKADNFDIGAFDPSIIQGLQKNGHQFALPYDFGPWVMFYNYEWFTKAGVALPRSGWTADDFVRAAKALTRDGKFGTAVPVPDAFMAFATSSGAHFLNDQGQPDLMNPGMKAAFASYVALATTEKVAPVYPSSGTISSLIANGRFTAGDIAMYVDGPWQLLNIRKKASFKVGVAPLPVRQAGSITLSAGSGFGIATTSRHPEEAWKAIQVLTGPDAERFLASAGRAFAARTAYQVYWYDTAAKDVEGAHEALSAALKNARPYVTSPNWNTVASLFEQYAPVAFAGSQPPDKVLETIQSLATQ
jgi:multiple sugar transport system substrate-binding protein/raffinose/stachyose/melibiose transport system substrate-binding protein